MPQKFLVNLNKVKEFKDNIINVNDTYIPISKYRSKEFRHKLTKILKIQYGFKERIYLF